MDKLARGIAADGSIRIFSAITTDTVAEAVRRHKTAPTATAALGRLMTGAVLLGASFKDFDRLTLKIESDGPIGGITAEANAHGGVRGYVKNPLAEIAPNANGKFDVKGLVGQGNFFVIREAGFEIGLRPEPYVGSVPIVSGEIAEDLAYYLATSEQIPAAVVLGVLLMPEEPFVAASGGVMVQILPGANPHLVTMIEDTLAHAPHLTSVIGPQTKPAELIEHALGSIGHEVLGESDVMFECTCSVAKAVTMISALGRDEVASMLKDDAGAVMNCGFCNEVYSLDASGLEAILSSL